MVSAVQQVQASSHLNELWESFRKVPGHDKWKTKEKEVNSKVLTRKSRNSQNIVSPMLLNVQLLCQINERCHVYTQVVFQPPHCVPKASVVLYHYWVISWALLPLCLRFPPYISDNSFVVFFFCPIFTLSNRVASSIISSPIISLFWTYFELSYSVLVWANRWGYTLTWNVSLFLSLLFFSSFRDLRNNLISTVEPGAFRGLLALRRL